MTVGLTSTEVCRRVGVPFVHLDRWTRTGLTPPSAAPPRGSGRWRLWTEMDLATVAVVKEMSAGQMYTGGATRVRVRRVVASVVRAAPDVMYVILVGGQAAVPVRSDADLLAWASMPSMPVLTVVKVAEIVAASGA